MGQGPQIDYDALAKQAGAISSATPAIDYDALAKQHGATSSQVPAPKSRQLFGDYGPTMPTKEGVANALPWVGGVLGGMAGAGVGSMGTAALGGVAGEAAKQYILDPKGTQPPGEAALDIATSGLEQSLLAGGSLALSRALGAMWDAASPMRAGFASRFANSALGTPKAMISRGFDPGAELARQDISAATRGQMRMNPDTGISAPSGGLVDKIQPVLEQTGQQLNKILTQPAAQQMQLDVSGHVAQIANDSIQQALKSGNEGLAQAIGKRAASIIKNNVDGPMTPAAAHSLKVDIGKGINWNASTDDDVAINNFLQDVYRGINDDISSAIPGTRELQTVYGNLSRAQDALAQKIAGTSGKAIVPGTVMSASEKLVPFPTAIKTGIARAVFPYDAPVPPSALPLRPSLLLGAGEGRSPSTLFTPQRGYSVQTPQELAEQSANVTRGPVIPPRSVRMGLQLPAQGETGVGRLTIPQRGYTVETPQEILERTPHLTKAEQIMLESLQKTQYLGTKP